jgi:RHS repeat-associated protein
VLRENVDNRGSVWSETRGSVCAETRGSLCSEMEGSIWAEYPNRPLCEEFRFSFNGKENDNEVKGEGNQQDYGFRIYDPRLGKFLSVDPLAKQFPWYTPYQFSGNKVINSIDMDGAEELLVIRWYDNDKYIGQSYIYVPTSQRVLENGVVYIQAQYNNQSDRELWNLENTKNRDGHWNVSTQRSENFTTEQKQYIFIDNSENIQEGVLYSELPRNKKEGNRLSQLRTDFEGVPGTANKPGLNSTIVDYPGKLILNYKLNDSDVDGITNNGPLVEGYIRYLRDNPDFNLSVNGHTSPEGGDNINIPLSLDRANNVRNKLIEGGISGSRIKSQGFGSTSRNCQENSTDCYESNRRVEVTDGVPKN